VTNRTAASPLKNNITPNELQIGFVIFANMRANGVRTLAAWCLGRGCNHFRVLDVSAYADDVPVPGGASRWRKCRRLTNVPRTAYRFISCRENPPCRLPLTSN
jgi:hypothetical protein